MIEIGHVDHVGIRVADLDRSVVFYGVLGFELLHKDPNGQSEAGLWICTPGTWECHVTHDEFCHFLVGRCTYTHESGEVIEIVPETAAYFPAGWKGICQVHETVRKVYMIR